MRATPPRAGAIYCRISHDPSGERLGVRRQQVDCMEHARRAGWAIAEVYVDDDRSAYNPKKPRPEYERLLQDIELGRRDGVLVWRLDRLHRQPRELEAFIVLCDKRDVALATVTGDVDLATSQGRLLARAWGAFAAHECEVRAERQRRANLDRAQRGVLPRPAFRLYGYTKGTMRIRSAEAKVIRELASRVLAGESLRAISADLNCRRIRTAAGGVWQSSTLRALLVNPVLAGISCYRGQPVGRGAWNGILTRRQSARLRLHLTDPARGNGRGVNRSYPLRGVIRCGRCGGLMVGATRLGRRGYLCRKDLGPKRCGRVSILADDVEPVVFTLIEERLESEALRRAVDLHKRSDAQWMRAAAAYHAATRRLQQLGCDYALERLTRAEWMAMRTTLLQQIAEVEPEITSDRSAGVLAEFIGNAERFRQAWPRIDTARRRAIVRAIVVQATVWPAPNPSFPAAQRVQIWWHGDAKPPRRRRGALHGVAERRAAGAFTQCAVDGCERPYLANGFCSMHYERIGHHGEPGGPGVRRLPNYHGAPCLVAGCARRAETRGRCGMHYMVWKRSDASRPGCEVPGCERRAAMSTFCEGHYQQRWRARNAAASNTRQ
ncbi:MAG: recombinase family protein, partial [Candidatus Dormibacteraeota bacterium]|nr:recombinase family protein [Candidatus Dormibacteraeota bacterium]